MLGFIMIRSVLC